MGMLKEDINCQFYFEAFILLPVSDGDTNVSLTNSQVLTPTPSQADVYRGAVETPNTCCLGDRCATQFAS
jgi:hypothetical protein